MLGKVIDVTHVVRSEAPELVQSIIAAAGSDVSHWFTKDGELKTVHDLKSGLRRYQTPVQYPLQLLPQTSCNMHYRATCRCCTRRRRIRMHRSTCRSRSRGGAKSNSSWGC